MKSKIKGKGTKVPNPFEKTSHKTERTAVSILVHWMREIIESKNIDLGLPDVETMGADRKMPDIVIYESRRSQNILCVIEAKPPYYDVFDEKDLKEPAREKATQRRAKYFCVTNFKRLIWYSTEKANALRPEEEQIIDKYTLSEIENLDDIEQPKYSNSIKRGLEDFLTKLYYVSTGREPEPKLPIDEFLVFRLQEKINRLSTYYRRIIEDQCHKDPSFASKLKNWFVEQGWNFAWQSHDFDKAARQTAYLLVNKILFYNLLQAKRPQELDPLDIPESLTKGDLLQKTLQAYFEQVLKIDYESIYTTDFIDSVAFPEDKEVVKEIKDLINVLKRYDFSKLGYDVIGRIFERLIPPEERHNLGQYFTNPDVVDLILRFCLNHEDDKVLDPACGAGTFLVRAYQHKKLMNQRLTHEKILETLWGVDIAKFPAHLATINLAINDLGVEKNYPRILHKDFFAIIPQPEGGFRLPEKWSEVSTKTLGAEEKEFRFPGQFDAIVGNPPYTRQEEIPKIGVDKEKLIENALKDISGNKKLAEISKRAGIHAYFFVHGTKFLKDGGYFGFIVSNSWLDVEYGKGLQKFFLENYKIIAIIESKVERWFEEADVNTCIVILQKCKNKEERDTNLVRFVYLKKPLRHFIPPAQDMWEKQIERIHAIDKLKKTILVHNAYYENEELRIFPKSQKELWDEGFDHETNEYVGAKWGKYLRAPGIFFKILEKGKGKLVPLKEVAKVRRGFTTGADPWFYVKDITDQVDKEQIEEFAKSIGYPDAYTNLKFIQSGDGTKWFVEKKYLYPVICNPESYQTIYINTQSVKDFVIIINESREELKGKAIEKYIIHGEKKAYKMGKGRNLIPAKTKTCSSRKYWYQLPNVKPSRILWQKAFDIYYRHHIATEEIFANQRFYNIYPKNNHDTEVIAAYLNSILIPLYLEFQRSIMGLGAVEATVEEVKNILVVNPRKLKKAIKNKLLQTLNKLGIRKIESIFSELGASSPEEVSLEKVKPDRRELDKIIMGEILGLTDEEQLEVYRAVIDLVKSRIEKAKSVSKKESNEEIDINSIKDVIIEKIRREQ